MVQKIGIALHISVGRSVPESLRPVAGMSSGRHLEPWPIAFRWGNDLEGSPGKLCRGQGTVRPIHLRTGNLTQRPGSRGLPRGLGRLSFPIVWLLWLLHVAHG